MRKLLAIALAFGWLAAPSASGSLADAPWKTKLQSLAERLYVNYRSLDDIYHQLHDAAIETSGRSAEELSSIQKAYLFVSQANLIAFYQWELLVAVDYIEEEKMADYLTLRIKDLDRSIVESRDRINSLKLYSGFIDHDAALQSIDQAIGIIEANIYTYEALHELLRPQANPPNRYNQRL